MPRIFRFGSYWVYFWTNENEPLEPVHVHISEGNPSENSTKVWITKSGKCYLCHNKSKTPLYNFLKKNNAQGTFSCIISLHTNLYERE